MKSDVSAVQLKERRKVSYTEGALLAVILVIASKVCTLPSILAGVAGSKAIWSALILVAIEIAILFFALKTAKCGGVPALPLKRGVLLPILLFFALFFTLKLAALSREIATYFALSLFENAPVLPITVLLLAACALLASKGTMAIGRLIEIFLWLFVFVFLFVVIFTRTEGDLFNALGMFSPDLTGIGEGVVKGMAWFGDGAALAFVDLRGEEKVSLHAQGVTPSPDRTKAKRRIAFAALFFSALTVVLFFAVFTSSYGDAAKMTDYAFVKLSAFKANTDELGSADWPVIILWSVVSCLYLALLFLSGESCLKGIVRKEKGKSVPFYLLLGTAAILIGLLALDEEGSYEFFMTKIMNIVTFLAAGATVGVGIYSLVRKGETNEKAD